MIVNGAWASTTMGVSSDPELDKLIAATKLLMADVPVMPTMMLQNLWAVEKGIGFKARADEYTLAMDANPTPWARYPDIRQGRHLRTFLRWFGLPGCEVLATAAPPRLKQYPQQWRLSARGPAQLSNRSRTDR